MAIQGQIQRNKYLIKTNIKMKKIFYLAAIAAVFAACEKKPEGPQVIIEETTYEGEGKLQYFGEEGTFETNHTYKSTRSPLTSSSILTTITTKNMRVISHGRSVHSHSL